MGAPEPTTDLQLQMDRIDELRELGRRRLALNNAGRLDECEQLTLEIHRKMIAWGISVEAGDADAD